jgi:DNA-binding NarL/FixJ family response regulator
MKRILGFLISTILVWEMVRLLQKSTTNLQKLSDREQEILNLIVVGETDNEIVMRFHLDEDTLEKCLCNILRKLGAHDISSAIKQGIEKGLVTMTYA